MTNLTDFIETYITEEPITPETIKWAIRKFIYLNYEPTKAEKLAKYEEFINLLGQAVANNNKEMIQTLLKRSESFYIVQNEAVFKDESDERCLRNEAFYNLLK